MSQYVPDNFDKLNESGILDEEEREYSIEFLPEEIIVRAYTEEDALYEAKEILIDKLNEVETNISEL